MQRVNKGLCRDWPDGIITVASYITDAQVVHHHEDKVGLPAQLLPCDITPCCQEQGEEKMRQQGGPWGKRLNQQQFLRMD